MSEDTIYARASGAGKAGVAVFRLSGPRAHEIARRLAGKSLRPRRPTLVNLKSSEDGTLIDQGLAILFEGPASFTGEDVAELQLHGSAAVEAALYEALSAEGARVAAPGEFTRRALENGKLDLAQVEALADLIDAETSEQRKQALGQLGGRLSTLAESWRDRLLAVMAPLEADIDFPDEEDVPAAVAAKAGPAIEALLAELRDYRAGAKAGRAIRDGVNIVIIGAPNAGKSSLLNRLAGSDRAIVSDRPGTTRDVIEVRLDLGGVPATLADTAGLRNHYTDDIELEGMRRASARAQDADLRILVVEAGDAGASALPADVSRETFPMLQPGDMIVVNKIDIAEPELHAPEGMTCHRLSAKTGEGVEAFLAALRRLVADRVASAGHTALTRARHVEAVDAAIAALEQSLSRLATSPELAAEDARLAARALGGITGAVGVEDILGEIFSSFCIGK